ncbi:ATP-binding protein [Archangium lansingense]|uniref:AAA family ATPase n=1 Tax=Archangium lansingense TaxID=2995310 RepID=A0ABT4ABL4_9BACT|nr:AAA family ATPase [Archangium lansinium]MCY1078711.1 AAA family ATPase [Archangium lansinium]
MTARDEEDTARVTDGPETDWTEANQRYLSAALARVRVRLERHAAKEPREPAPEEEQALEEAAAALPAPAALERLRTLFQLSPFERDVLLLCAGMELDATFAPRCASAQGDPRRPWPTFGLALAALPEAHWSALSPSAPLRRWRLVEVGAGDTLTASPLRIDERVLHYLAGLSHPDERLVGVLEPQPPPDMLVPSHQTLARRILVLWAQPPKEGFPVVQLCGPEEADTRAIAAAACTAQGMDLYRIHARGLPSGQDEIPLARLLWREAALNGGALLLDCHGLEPGDTGHMGAVLRFIERARGPLLVSGRERLRIPGRAVSTFDVARPTPLEQRQLWSEALAPVASASPELIARLVTQFDLVAPAIRDASAGTWAYGGEEELGRALWEACRARARPRLDDLAQRLEPAAVWDDLVLPEVQQQVLRDVLTHVRHRSRVYETWGFASKGARGLGISAMFAGPSGTGKTLAAEVLAHELRLDLYRIDLSQVVSKYIGETEKNLRRVFDAAEEGGAILLFDEADALFGKRGEVSNSHDRYANIEVGYLLQRMEAYRGLAILTTNMKSALDPAFLRRIRFVVQFPFPGPAERAEIWRRIFPRDTPTEGLDYARLARLDLAGGNIRNIALNAAFLAAEEGTPVRMQHLSRAARSELSKLDKPLTGVGFD